MNGLGNLPRIAEGWVTRISMLRRMTSGAEPEAAPVQIRPLYMPRRSSE